MTSTPQDGGEEETYRHLAESAAEEVPGLADNVILQGWSRRLRTPLKNAEDGTKNSYSL
jgi:hypothetical protein